MIERDPHSGPVSDVAWLRDAVSREEGRVQMFNATRPDGLDGWTIRLEQYDVLRTHILDMLAEEADEDGTLPLKVVVQAAQDRFGAHPEFPNGHVRNYCTFVKVDLEARCEIERIPRRSPQRITLWRADPGSA